MGDTCEYMLARTLRSPLLNGSPLDRNIVSFQCQNLMSLVYCPALFGPPSDFSVPSHSSGSLLWLFMMLAVHNFK